MRQMRLIAKRSTSGSAADSKPPATLSLVDYTSDASDASDALDWSEGDDNDDRPAKRQRTVFGANPSPHPRASRASTSGEHTTATSGGEPAPLPPQPSASSSSIPPSTTTPSSGLPPLPAAFHDLYAATVRTSTSDDPSLHQGRRRQNPHVRGNWPTHLYVEWYPLGGQDSILESLLDELQPFLTQQVSDADKDNAVDSTVTQEERAKLHSLCINDIGVSLPLHISLSRPIVIATAARQVFVDGVRAAVKRSGVAPFELRCEGVEWHRSEESKRSFLVLRVRSIKPEIRPNPELRELLKHCNTVASAFGQPELYQWATDPTASSRAQPKAAEKSSPHPTARQPAPEHSDAPEPSSSLGVVPRRAEVPDDIESCWVSDGSDGGYEDATFRERRKDVGHAFHISIGWTLADVTDELRRATQAVYARSEVKENLRDFRIRVGAVKAKVGNSVTTVPLVGPPGRISMISAIHGPRNFRYDTTF